MNTKLFFLYGGLKAAEVAEICGVSHTTICRLARNNVFKNDECVFIKKKLLFNPDRIDRIKDTVNRHRRKMFFKEYFNTYEMIKTAGVKPKTFYSLSRKTEFRSMLIKRDGVLCVRYDNFLKAVKMLQKAYKTRASPELKDLIPDD